jgi:hypothetical protein
VLIRRVLSTSEIVGDLVLLGALVDFISMADVDAIKVRYPHALQSC